MRAPRVLVVPAKGVMMAARVFSLAVLISDFMVVFIGFRLSRSGLSRSLVLTICKPSAAPRKILKFIFRANHFAIDAAELGNKRFRRHCAFQIFVTERNHFVGVNDMVTPRAARFYQCSRVARYFLRDFFRDSE